MRPPWLSALKVMLPVMEAVRMMKRRGVVEDIPANGERSRHQGNGGDGGDGGEACVFVWCVLGQQRVDIVGGGRIRKKY